MSSSGPDSAKTSPSIEQNLGTQWQWFLYVLLGGIGTLALRRLDEGFWAASTLGRLPLAHYCFFALCLFAFLVYDVGALAVLTQKFPYKISLLSALRYGVDLVMAFLVFLLLMSGLGPPPAANAPAGLAQVPAQSPLLLVVAISAWHINAALWHVLASVDHGQGPPRGLATLPHLIFAGLYWLIYGVSRWGWIGLSPMAFLSLIGCVILLVSIVRWFQVLSTVKPGR